MGLEMKSPSRPPFWTSCCPDAPLHRLHWGPEVSTAEKIETSELVVKSKIKALIADGDMRASADIWDEVGHIVARSVKKAMGRAQANGRKTVKASDF